MDAIENVEKVQKIVNNADYQAFSNIDWLEQTEQQSGMIQAVLGGVRTHGRHGGNHFQLHWFMGNQPCIENR